MSKGEKFEEDPKMECSFIRLEFKLPAPAVPSEYPSVPSSITRARLLEDCHEFTNKWNTPCKIDFKVAQCVKMWYYGQLGAFSLNLSKMFLIVVTVWELNPESLWES